MKARTFLKFFLTFLVIFTLIGIPLINAVSNVNLFQSDSTGDSTADSEGMLVDGSGTFYDKYSDVNRINLLMLGVNDKMTDTIMLLSWDLDNDNVDVISVPRDTYYHRDGYDGAAERKINSIYASQGVKPTAEAVSDVLYGIPINYYAIITYDAVEKIVDGIGGVPIYVKQDMHYEDPYDDPPLVIDIDKGQQTLDGEHAVQYLRYRHGYANGDLGRVEAQQAFMKALYKQCIKHGVISSAKLITDNIKSDLTLGAVSQYALSAMKLDENSISTYTVPGEGKYIGSTSYYVQDKDATKDMLNEIYSGTASDSGSSSSD
ncbi:MAG: LCP family protein [Anaerovoracaceae bacterium]|jgi:LCP family protein required for cell wall assembly